MAFEHIVLVALKHLLIIVLSPLIPLWFALLGLLGFCADGEGESPCIALPPVVAVIVLIIVDVVLVTSKHPAFFWSIISICSLFFATSAIYFLFLYICKADPFDDWFEYGLWETIVCAYREAWDKPSWLLRTLRASRRDKAATADLGQTSSTRETAGPPERSGNEKGPEVAAPPTLKTTAAAETPPLQQESNGGNFESPGEGAKREEIKKGKQVRWD